MTAPKRGRPPLPDSERKEKTVQPPARVPVSLLAAFRAKWGDAWSERLRTLIRRDVSRPVRR